VLVVVVLVVVVMVVVFNDALLVARAHILTRTLTLK